MASKKKTYLWLVTIRDPIYRNRRIHLADKPIPRQNKKGEAFRTLLCGKGLTVHNVQAHEQELANCVQCQVKLTYLLFEHPDVEFIVRSLDVEPEPLTEFDLWWREGNKRGES